MCVDRGLFGSNGRGCVEVDDGLGCLGSVRVLNLCFPPSSSGTKVYEGYKKWW